MEEDAQNDPTIAKVLEGTDGDTDEIIRRVSGGSGMPSMVNMYIAMIEQWLWYCFTCSASLADESVHSKPKGRNSCRGTNWLDESNESEDQKL